MTQATEPAAPLLRLPLYGVDAASADHVLLRCGLPDDGTLLQPGQGICLDGGWYGLLRQHAQGLDCLGPGHPADFAGCPHIAGRLQPSPGFVLTDARPRALILADAAGVVAAVALCDALRRLTLRVRPLVLIDVTGPLPFRPEPSRLMVAGLPPAAIATLPLLEDWRVPCRLCGADRPGAVAAPAHAVALDWLASLQGTADVALYACGQAGWLTTTLQALTPCALATQAVVVPHPSKALP